MPGHPNVVHVRLMAPRGLAAAMLGASIYAPANTVSQPEARIARVGVLNPQNAPQSIEAGLPRGLRDLGYVEGKNLVIEWRRSAETLEEMRGQATELSRSMVDVI